MGALLIPNKAALQFLQEAVDVMELRSSTECTICEFDACQYHLARSKSDGDTVSLSFKSDSNPAPLEKERITDIYASCAAVLAPVSEPGYQVTLQVALPELRALHQEQRSAAIEKLAGIRLYVTGAALRVLLQGLADGILSAAQELTLSSRGRPYCWLQGQPDRVTAVFPIVLKENAEDALRATFAQEFAEARRSAGHSTAPQLYFTPPGRPLPVDMEGAAGWEGAGNVGGYWTMVVLPHHVSTPARLDTMAWALLTLPAHLDAAVKGFKASLHEHMRGTCDALLARLQAARTDTVDERAPRQQRGAAAVQRHAAAAAQGGLLQRIRAKVHAAPARDMGSMLHRHKENCPAN